MIEFEVPGKAVAKQSARFANMGGFIKSYQKKEVVDYSNFVRLCFMNKYPDHKIEDLVGKALKITIIEYREVPKSKTKKFRKCALEGLIRPITKPDTDNIAKNIKDGLNKIVYPDDSQIVIEHIEKWYADSPKVVIKIEEYEWEEKN